VSTEPRVLAPPRLCAFASTVLAAATLAGCAAFRPATSPLRTVTIHEAAGARCLFVLLPGRRSSPEAFARSGFARSAAERGLAADLLAVDAHLGYYRNRSIVERLHAEILAPARTRYEEVWVVGTSLGGLGGLLVLRDHPAAVDGVVALAPFLGDRELVAAIRAAGGARVWQPPADEDDPGVEVWTFLRALDPEATAKLFVGGGEEDRQTPGSELLAALLPEGQAASVSGGHDLETWRRLWERFLAARRPCGAQSFAAR
jgi:pimeloyl-ACP methyl ester carboxylesterase